MFWWAVPVLYTGLLIFLVFGLLLLTFMLAMNVDSFSGILIPLGLPCIIGCIMMVVGFFFWALGDIWSPYI